MRRFLLAVAATAILSTSVLSVSAAPVSPGALREAIQETAVVDRVAACWRHGWRGWGWYRCGGYRIFRGYRWHRHWR